MVGDPSDTTMAPEWWSRALDDLRELVREHDDALAAALSVADSLGDYAVEARYPPVAPGVQGVTADEARTALETAGEAMGIVHDSLSRTLPDLSDPTSPDTGSGGRTR